MFIPARIGFRPGGLLRSSLLRCYSAGATAAAVEVEAEGAPATPKPYSAIPGPKGLPFLGNAIELRQNLQDLRGYFSQGFKKYGDIYKLNALGNRIVVIKDPTQMEHILRAEGKYPIRDLTLNPGMDWLAKKSNLKTPFGFLDGEEWKTIRTAVGKQATPRCVHQYGDGFNDIFNNFMEYIRSSRGEDGTLEDLVQPLKYLMIEVSAKFVFNSNIKVVENPSGEHKELVFAMNEILSVIMKIINDLPLYKLYNNDVSRRHKKAFEAINKISRKEVEKVYARMESREESATPGLLEQWLRGGKLSEEQAISEAAGMFGAGVDTTANQSAFLLHFIARDPEVQERLHEEVQSVMGDSKYPTPQQLAQMPYVKGCVQESFRLHPTTPTLSRLSVEDTNIQGYHIPARTTINYSSYDAGRDEKLFPNPLTFDPDRWQRDNPHVFSILPFGFGPRMCYGRRFAELEMKLLLVQMVLNFKMSTPLDELKDEQRAVTAPVAPFPVKFFDRK